MVPLLTEEIEQIRDIQYHKRWVKILKDYLAHDEVLEEIKRLSPYISQANEADAISLPSQAKYICILYMFLDRVFTKIAKIEEAWWMMLPFISSSLPLGTSRPIWVPKLPWNKQKSDPLSINA
jgi:hypothetical protein